jgi:hypothetical protein
VERGIVGESPATASRVVDAAAVARLLGRERQWVYDHAGELGAFRYGDGPRARLGFDAQTLERWKRERQRGPLSTGASPSRTPGTRRATEVTALIPYDGSGCGA